MTNIVFGCYKMPWMFFTNCHCLTYSAKKVTDPKSKGAHISMNFCIIFLKYKMEVLAQTEFIECAVPIV